MDQFRVLSDDVLKRADGKILQDLPDLPLGSAKIYIRLEGALAAHRQPRMIGNNLGRMNIEPNGTAVGKDFVSLLADEPVREKPQISATEKADALAHHIGDANGKLGQSNP